MCYIEATKIWKKKKKGKKSQVIKKKKKNLKKHKLGL